MDVVDTSRYRIPALSAENYYMWAHKMDFVLRSKGVWGIVSGREIAPTDETKLKLYERRRDVALTIIILTIDDSRNASVITLRDLQCVWHTLRGIYATASEARIDVSLSQYHIMKIEAIEKLMTYINRLSEVENKLAAVGHIVTDSEKRKALLRGLQEEYSTMVGVIRAWNKSYYDSITVLVTQEA